MDGAGGQAVGSLPPPGGVDAVADVLNVRSTLEHGKGELHVGCDQVSKFNFAQRKFLPEKITFLSGNHMKEKAIFSIWSKIILQHLCILHTPGRPFPFYSLFLLFFF